MRLTQGHKDRPNWKIPDFPIGLSAPVTYLRNLKNVIRHLFEVHDTYQCTINVLKNDFFKHGMIL